jgi:phosphoglycerol transferase
MRELLWYALLLLLTLAIMVAALRLWRADLRVPFVYEADALLHLMFNKALQDGAWYYENPYLGAPMGLESYDYPMLDGFSFLVIKLLVVLTQSYVVATNLFYLLTFVATALTAMFVLRQLRVAPPIALVVALLFAFTPTHFMRGEAHLFLSVHYMVPLLVLLAVSMWRERPGAAAPPGGDRRHATIAPYLGVALVCLIAGASGVYYAFFGCMLIAVAGVAQLAQQRDVGALARGAACIGLIAFSLLLNLAPTLLYVREHGQNIYVAHRAPSESEAYGLKIAHLLLPMDVHRWEPALKLAQQYAAGPPPLQTENTASSLGLVASLGFLGLLGVLLRPSGARPPPPSRRLAILNLACVLFATIGGFSALFAVFVTPQVRAPNRISAFIAFLSLAAVALFLDTLRRRYVRTGWQRAAFGVALGALLLLGISDQTTSAFVPQYAANRERFENDRAFVEAIEQRLPPGAMVFQLPDVQFPEGLRVRAVGPYDLSRGYLHSPDLHWSFGSMKGRDHDWRRAVAESPAEAILPQLAAVGYSGVYLDASGYEDGGRTIAAELASALEAQPLLSADGKLAFFDLRAYNAAFLASRDPASVARARESVLNPLAVGWGRGFYALEMAPGARWRWASDVAELIITNPDATPRAARLRMALTTGTEGVATVRLEADLLAGTATVGTTPVWLDEWIDVPPGQHVLQFVSTDTPVLPSPGDPRRRSFRVINFQLVDAAAAELGG